MAEQPVFGSGVVSEEIIRAMLLEEHARLSQSGLLMGDTFQQNWGTDPVYKVGATSDSGGGPVIDLGATSQLLNVNMDVLAGSGRVVVTPVPLIAAEPIDYGELTPTAGVVPLVGLVSMPVTSYAAAAGSFVGGRLGRVFFTGVRNRQITGIRVGTLPMVVMGPGSSRSASYVPGGGTGDTYFSEV